MKTSIIYIGLFLLSVTMAYGQDCNKEYLRKVLDKLETIHSASYYTQEELWEPGDTVPHRIWTSLTKEYDNPQDTTIGASYVDFEMDDTTKLHTGYDGKVKVSTFHEHKGLVIDDFTFVYMPFRFVGAPFFNLTKSMIRYMLEEQDSMTLESKELEDYYYYKLIINKSEQVEFFGKAYTMPGSGVWGDPTSIYELWISKANDLPYKYRKEMSHLTTVSSYSKLKLNRLSLADFHLSDYYPEDYEIRYYSDIMRKKAAQKALFTMVDKKAPDWTLNDKNGKALSLNDIKSKIIVINFTGIGCGPCMLAIPFLNTLKDKFRTEDVQLVAIETWGRDQQALLKYANRHQMNYNFLEGNEQIIKDYLNGSRGVPIYYILDEQRIVRKSFNGYSKETSDQEITDAITSLLQSPATSNETGQP